MTTELEQQQPDSQKDIDQYRTSFYQQMETMLLKQIEKCDYWKKYFEKQNNVSMAARFDAYLINTVKNLELLKLCKSKNESVPKYKFEFVSFNCVPTNVDVLDKELQLIVKARNLPVEKGTPTYIIAEFAYPHPKDETFTNTLTRLAYYISIDSKNLVACCSPGELSQQDKIHSVDTVPFHDLDSQQVEYCRPISFYIERPKSKSLRRKFKQVKLTFFEKKPFLASDKKIGTVQFKIDDVNDEITALTGQYIMNGRKQTEAIVDVRIRVRQALFDRSVRAHEEKFLVLT